MIQNVTAKIDGKLITFVSTDGKSWYVSSVAPDTVGIYDVELTLTNDKGVSYTYTPSSEDFEAYLKLYVTNRSSDLMRYVPHVYRKFDEFKPIMEAGDLELDLLYPAIESIFTDSIIMYCSEERLSEWEKALGIIPSGTVEERRYFLKAFMRGTGKLNEAKIKSIVEAFTGGEAIVTFIEKDSLIDVKVMPPNNGEVFRFPDVERALKPLIPAHLQLSVTRFYSTWGDIKNNFADWNDVMQFKDWNEVKNWIAP